ncbi:MAG TPA: hypothetical protein VMU74_10250 [Gaiellaceae bacterium]|nr:hypothetical protein [Gaiellaceae bacterium]
MDGESHRRGRDHALDHRPAGGDDAHERPGRDKRTTTCAHTEERHVVAGRAGGKSVGGSTCPARSGMRSSPTRAAFAVTVTSSSDRRCWSATITVISFVMLAIGNCSCAFEDARTVRSTH